MKTADLEARVKPDVTAIGHAELRESMTYCAGRPRTYVRPTGGEVLYPLARELDPMDAHGCARDGDVSGAEIARNSPTADDRTSVADAALEACATY